MMRFSDKVYEAVQCIPRGRVATYGLIAERCGSPGASRAVGNALHKNPRPGVIPCHRIVSATGRLAPNFAFGGPDGQRKLLEAEGVRVQDGFVDLKRYLDHPPI